tara:strand:+ start:3404 stop:4573 length:1170 start_codon:yes stop_codon:yes gene_type:complete
MNENNLIDKNYNNEVDLIEIFDTLLKSKWTIILFMIIAFIIGISFSYTQPKLISSSTSFDEGERSVFIDYFSINSLLKDNELLSSDENSNGYLIDAKTVFYLIINEFADYDEMLDVLKNNEYVRQSINKLDEQEKIEKLLEYAKYFTIKLPSKVDTSGVIKFEWHNYLEGINLLNEALSNTLINVKATLLKDIENLAQTIEEKNQRELSNLRNNLNLLIQNQQIRNEKYLQYLFEQSAIAKELDIETNMLDVDTLSKKTTSSVSLNISSNELPFYLRGFKAIDKEIYLIKNRSEKENLLMIDGYVEINEEIKRLENDLSAFHLRSYLKLIENDSPDDWVSFDLSISETQSLDRSIIYIFLSIGIGAVLGSFYVLIMNNLRKRNLQVEKV